MVRTDAETQLVVRLLGDPEVRWGATPIKAFDSPRLRSLLAFLIVGRERAISRQRLAFEFWPDSTEGQARTNLRQALHHIRHALADADRYLRVDSRSVQWLADSPAVIDLIEFEAAARAGLRSGDEYLLVRAADDYRGDLLAGCYDEWLGPERDRLQALAGSVLRALGELAHGRGQWARAADVAERLLRLDPLDEAAHRLLIDAHASAGDRVRALRRYHECAAVLARELGVAPAADTMALHDALIAGDRRAEPCESVEPTADHAPLVGRYEELQVLIDAWDDIIRGRPHFVLVTGEPGIGKTRLVEELIAICRRESALTAVARAYEAEGALPYGPVIDVLRTEAMQGSVDALDADGRRELARV